MISSNNSASRIVRRIILPGKKNSHILVKKRKYKKCVGDVESKQVKCKTRVYNATVIKI